MTDTTIRRALISVSDKSNIVELSKFLIEHDIEILSTGGTARALSLASIPHTEVSAYTEFPETMDGRVKTLHPRIHGGILSLRDYALHTEAMIEHGINAIDLVVVNLYPFEDTVSANADRDTCINNIDIGGPALLRAAAKNYRFVTVVSNPAHYTLLYQEMAANHGSTELSTRQRLAAEAFRHTALYDRAISTWFTHNTSTAPKDELWPERLSISARRSALLRYGENPHQTAALYIGDNPRSGVASAEQVQGRHLSFNNFKDADAAYELVSEFKEEPAVAIIKHGNPCGTALGPNLATAYRKALSCDTTSAFGGIVAANQHLDGETASEIIKLFTEVVIAPSADDDALNFLATKPQIRLMLTGTLPSQTSLVKEIHNIAGGFLIQTRDDGIIKQDEINVVTRRSPSEIELADLIFAFTVAKHVKSNAIVYAKDKATVGVGAGQMSRLDSARIATNKAHDSTKAQSLQSPLTHGAVMASDAFFPFADGLLTAIEAGITAVIQPGGSKRDEEVIAAANKAGLAMVFTGMRHFRH